MDPQQALEALQNPQTPPETLAWIAEQYPNLWPGVLAHPNCYPELAQWIHQSMPPAQNVATGSTPVASNKKSKRWVAPVVVASALVVGAGVGGYFWLAGSNDVIALDTLYTGVPVVETTVQLPEDVTAKQLRLSPSAHETLRAEDLTIVALQPSDGTEQTTFVAFDDAQIAYPQWVVAVDAADPHCVLSSETFDCGSLGAYDTKTGWVQVPSSDREPEPTEGKVDVGADSVQILPTATENIPFTFASGELKDADGKVLESLPGEQVWALSDAQAGGHFWVFSDGQKLVAVNGKSVAWSVDLPEGSDAVNQFDTDAPTWALDGSVLIVGEPDRVVGYNPLNGEERWVVDAPELTSWSVQGTDLFLLSEDVLHVAPFALDGGQPQSAPAGGVVTLNAPWGDAEFTNGSYQFPASCLEWASQGDAAAFGFDTMEEMQQSHFEVTDGAVGESGRPQITYDTSAPLYVGGEAYTVAQFWCANGGNYPFQYMAIYDTSGSLVADTHAEPSVSIGGHAPHPVLTDLQSSGSIFTQELDGIGVAGDESCGACATSASATITEGWDGTNWRRLDVLYHTPLGDSRTPNLEAVQAAYDAAANGDDVTAAEYFTSQAMEDIQSQTFCAFEDCLFEENMSAREAILPPGAKVEECDLAASDFTNAGGNNFGQGYSSSPRAYPGQFPTILGIPRSEGSSPDYGEAYFQGGTYFCGVNTEGTGHWIQSPMTLDGDRNPHYTLWLAVQSDPDGNPSNMMAVEDVSRMPGVIG